MEKENFEKTTKNFTNLVIETVIPTIERMIEREKAFIEILKLCSQTPNVKEYILTSEKYLNSYTKALEDYKKYLSESN